MAKKSAIERNKKRRLLSERHRQKRHELKKTIMDRKTDPQERIETVMKLAKLPRNGCHTRVRLRCEVTGRSRGNYRKFQMSRIAVRELALMGQIPGMTKSSW